MLHPIILLELGRAHQRDLLAEAEARRRTKGVRHDNPSLLLAFASGITRILTTVDQSLQIASQQLTDRRAAFAVRHDSLTAACEDPACAC